MAEIDVIDASIGLLTAPNFVALYGGQLLGDAALPCGHADLCGVVNITRSFSGTDPQTIMTFAMTGWADQPFHEYLSRPSWR